MSPTTFLLRVFIVLFIIVMLDIYVFKGIKVLCQDMENKLFRKIVYGIFWGITICLILYLFALILTFKGERGPTKQSAILMSLFVLFTLPKIIFGLFLLGEDIFRLFRATSIFATNLLGPDSHFKGLQYFSERRKFISQIALAVSAIPFLGVLHGITKGKYKYTVHKQTIFFKDLPIEFDGLTMAQISDVHSGSFDNIEEVKKGIQMINDLNADVIVFTGDIVNNVASEFKPWIKHFSKLQAPLGKFSILGNHDYGDYAQFENDQAKVDNLNTLKKYHSDTGFKLLLNERISFERGGSKFNLAGVENWGLPPFPQYGNLNLALSGLEKDAFTVLLSHDPSHWDAQVLQHPQNVSLTLSGHTHGMQFGVEIPGWRWSPVQYRYPNWAGLYQKAEKYLYVNRGFGFIGFPGRVGIWPEITHFTFKRA